MSSTGATSGRELDCQAELASSSVGGGPVNSLCSSDYGAWLLCSHFRIRSRRRYSEVFSAWSSST